MRTTNWLISAVLGLLLTGCAGISTAPTPEARQALAPTGKLRVGLQQGNPLNVIRDPASGEMRGLAFDLGTELARRLAVPFEPVLYPSIGALLEGGKSGAWDVAHFGFTPERAKEFDLIAPHVEVEFGYLIPSASSISTMADVDRPGIRVAVQEKSGPEAFFSRTLKDAVLTRAPSNPGALALLKSGGAEVMGSIKPILSELSIQMPGSRILDGRPGTDPHVVAMPRGRGSGVAYLSRFIEGAKSEGLVNAAIERAGLRGVVVAGHK